MARPTSTRSVTEQRALVSCSSTFSRTIRQPWPSWATPRRSWKSLYGSLVSARSDTQFVDIRIQGSRVLKTAVGGPIWSHSSGLECVRLANDCSGLETSSRHIGYYPQPLHAEQGTPPAAASVHQLQNADRSHLSVRQEQQQSWQRHDELDGPQRRPAGSARANEPP